MDVITGRATHSRRSVTDEEEKHATPSNHVESIYCGQHSQRCLEPVPEAFQSRSDCAGRCPICGRIKLCHMSGLNQQQHYWWTITGAGKKGTALTRFSEFREVTLEVFAISLILPISSLELLLATWPKENNGGPLWLFSLFNFAEPSMDSSSRHWLSIGILQNKATKMKA